MAWRAQIVTPWADIIGPDGKPGKAPVFHEAGLPHLRWTDVTGQDAENLLPDPNAYTIEVECETEADLDAIAEVFLEVWREEISADPITGGL